MRTSIGHVYFLVGLVLSVPVIGESQASQEFPAPGRLLEVSGRKLHLYCTGKGSPTVVLMAGGGAYAIDWALVQPKLAAETRVCSYDRAGLGWSDPGPADETVEQTVSDLRVEAELEDENRAIRAMGTHASGG